MTQYRFYETNPPERPSWPNSNPHQTNNRGPQDKVDRSMNTQPNSHYVLPEGFYEATIVGCKPNFNPRPMVIWDFCIEVGLHAGKPVRRWHNLNSDSAIDHITRDFRKLGIVLENPSDLSRCCAEAIGKRIGIHVVINDYGANAVYLSNQRPHAQDFDNSANHEGWA